MNFNENPLDEEIPQEQPVSGYEPAAEEAPGLEPESVLPPEPAVPKMEDYSNERVIVNDPFVMQEPAKEEPPRVEAAAVPEAAAPVKKEERKTTSRVWGKAAAGALALVIFGTCCIAFSSLSASRRAAEAQAEAAATIQELTQRLDDLQTQLDAIPSQIPVICEDTAPSPDGMLTPREVFAANERSVVSVSCVVQSTGFGGQAARGTSTGSGFVLSKDGYVVTNYHVVEDAISASVVMHDDQEYPATIVGYDENYDVAVLKIDADNLIPVTIGSSDALYVGDYVVAIGNPLGSLTATMTFGIVSGKDRQVTTDSTVTNMLQMDTAINSGNSGGPLFNLYGQVVGITTAKYSGMTSSGLTIEGLSFAIPIDDVMHIISDLRDFGYVTGAYLGVTVRDTDSATASMYGIPMGAYVVTVEGDYAAKRAGIQEKDIITMLDEYEVTSVKDLTRALARFKAGDTVKITVYRAGQTITMDITLDEKPRDLNSSGSQNSAEMPSGDFEEWYNYFFGNGKPTP